MKRRYDGMFRKPVPHTHPIQYVQAYSRRPDVSSQTCEPLIKR